MKIIKTLVGALIGLMLATTCGPATAAAVVSGSAAAASSSRMLQTFRTLTSPSRRQSMKRYVITFPAKPVHRGRRTSLALGQR